MSIYYSDFVKETGNKPVNYSSYSNETLCHEVKSFSKLNQKISLPTWLLYLYFEEVLTESLKIILSEKCGDVKRATDIISSLSHPSRITPLDAYNRDLYQLVLEPEHNAKKALETFLGKYVSWGVYDVNYEIVSADSHKNKIKDIDKNKATKLISEIDVKYENQLRSTLAIKQQWKGDKQLSAMIDLYSLYAYFKDWKNYYREQNAYKLKILFKEIASRLALTPEQVSFLTEEEACNLLKGNLTVSAGELDKRIRNSAFLFFHDILTIITDIDDLRTVDSYLYT